MDDNNKRVLIAVVLSIAVLFGWQFLFPPKQPAPQQSQVAETAQQTADQAQAQQAAPAPVPVSGLDATPGVAAGGRTLVVDTPLYRAEINSQGGVLERFVLKDYKQSIEPGAADVDLIGPAARGKAPLGLILNVAGAEHHTWTKGDWTTTGDDLDLSGDQTGDLVFTSDIAGMRVERRLTFSAGTYVIDETATVTNMGDTGMPGTVAFTAAAKSMSAEDNRYNPTRIAYRSEAEGLEEVTSRDDLETEGINVTQDLQWAAIDSNYFIFALVPQQGKESLLGRVQDDVFRLAVSVAANFDPKFARQVQCSYFLGPMDLDALAKAPGGLDSAVDFGWFDFLAKPLLIMLDWFYGYVHNYGVAIILLTIVIKILFWPLSHKSYKSMNQMKKLQPMIAKIKEKHGDDRQKIQQETMQLYKTYKVNPAGGCMPMLLQIPVFFGLYKALLGAIELRHAVFIEHLPFTDILWLADLSAKDPLYITPLIMGATMFLQQKMTPSAGDPTQQKIMMLMPVVFTFIFLNFPSGLVIYWLCNNVLSIAQQWWLLRDPKNNPKPEGEKPEKSSAAAKAKDATFTRKSKKRGRK